MIKFFIVETNAMCNEIKEMIHWEKEGFECVGEANDGEMALPMIRETYPELLILDTDLPIINGFQLSKLVMDEMPWIKIIMLSSHKDFHYVKEAMDLGITTYLEKPIDCSELSVALKKVSKLVCEGQFERINFEIYKNFVQHNNKMKFQKFFIDLVTKDIPLHDMLEKGRIMNIDLVAKQYNIVLCQISVKGKQASVYDTEVSEVIHTISNIYQDDLNIISSDLPHGIIAYFLKGTDHKSIENGIRNIIHNVQKVVNELENIEYFIAVGKEVSRLSEISSCFKLVLQAFSYRFFLDKSQVFYSYNIDDYKMLKVTKSDIRNIKTSKFNRSSLNRYLVTGDKTEARAMIEKYLENLGQNFYTSSILCKYATLDLYFLCASIMEDLGFSSDVLIDLCGDPQDTIISANNIEDIIAYLEKLFQTVMEYKDTYSTKKNNSLLIKARDYIHKNYADPELSLQSIANLVNISPSYFSTIFSQELGMSFIEYLTSIRMEKATELLLHSDRKSSEIGYSVGYSDPHYFSYIFKKNQGVTPKEYRTGKKDRS